MADTLPQPTSPTFGASHPPLQGPILPGSGFPKRGKKNKICFRGKVEKPKWRIISLCMMGITFVILLLAVMTTHWRVDKENRYDVLITHGLWRICRDIKFGSTLDHKCLSEFANIGPDWFHTVRGFMLIALLCTFFGFVYSVYLITNLPIITNPKYPNVSVSLALPGLLYMVAAICVLVASCTYTVATSMDYGLYFPENLEPTWGNSWAEVLAKRNSMPSDLPEVAEMKMKYGYSFALAWLSLFTTSATFIVNFIASAS